MSVLFRLCLLTVLTVCAGGIAAAAEHPSPPAPAMQLIDPRPEAVMTVAELEKRTAAGDLKAQAELGARYGQGRDVTQDIPKAIALLKAAAEKGDPDAQYFLGTAYSSGLGVPQSDMQAFALYEKAADQGHPPANFALASMIIGGKAGLIPIWDGAIRYLWTAATKNYPPAMALLGAAYQDGKGVEVNPRAAAYWYRRSLSLVQSPNVIYNLRILINAGAVPYEDGDPGEQPEKTSDRDRLSPVQTAGQLTGQATGGKAKP
jgi:TPR repeat protein